MYVKPEGCGKGCGKAILKKLASIAVERGCGRLEWWCLDWNWLLRETGKRRFFIRNGDGYGKHRETMSKLSFR